jgi:hypothetical protein
LKVEIISAFSFHLSAFSFHLFPQERKKRKVEIGNQTQAGSSPISTFSFDLLLPIFPQG